MKNKSFYTLGLNEGLCASAALLKDGKIIAAASEERFTRIKNQWGFPKKAIEFCYKYAGIKSSEIELIVLSYKDPYVHFTYGRAHESENIAPKSLLKLRNIAPSIEYSFPASRTIFDLGRKIYYQIYQPINQKKQILDIASFLNISKGKIIRMDHHLCHAYTAYFSNQSRSEKETLVLTCDGAGDQFCTSIHIVNNGNFLQIIKSNHTSSLGLLYSSVTHLLGLKAHEDEYKVMGLAPYAPYSKIQKAYDIFKNMFWVDRLTFRSVIPSRHFDFYLKNKLQYIRFDHIAGAIQKFTEDILLQWCKNAIKETKIKNIVCGGGVFLNIKANKLLAQKLQVEKIFFMPSSGDDTNSIGAAYYGYQLNRKSQIANRKDLKPLENLYLGPEYSETEIVNAFKKYPQFKISKPKNLSNTIAQLLAKGEIVARFSGKMEMGARALGNRSIIADPRKYHLIEKINKMIKMRDFWMPFSPTILFEKHHQYIKNPENIPSPFMTIAFDTTVKGQKDLSAAIHPYDKTARAQILKKEDNQKYYEIIEEFEKLTGVAAVLNTSFNIHGEPIVCTPEDALSTLKRSGLKYLTLGDFMVIKNE